MKTKRMAWAGACVLAMMIMLMSAGCGGGGGSSVTTGAVTGTVVDGNGDPVADAVVVVGSSSWAATTNIMGEFAVSGMPAGTYAYRVMAGNGYTYKSGNVTVAAGAVTTMSGADVTLTADADTSDNPTLTSAAITKAGDSYTVTLTVTVADTGSDVSAVTAACPELDKSVTLNDDSTGGDTTASDGVYSVSVELTSTQTSMLTNWYFGAYDAAGNAGNVAAVTYGSATASSISAIIGRDSDGSATYAGKAFTVEGVVLVDSSLLANKKLRIHIQDSTGGIAVGAEEDVASNLPSIAEGDNIQVTGILVQEAETDNSIGTPYIKINSASDLMIESSGNTLPDPEVISGDDCVSQYQAQGATMGGELVQIKGVSLTDSSQWPAANAKSTDVTIQDTDGNTMTMRIQKNSDIKGTTPPSGSFDVVGLVRQHDTNDDGDYNEGFVIWPRTTADITTSASRVLVASN